jgi:hypothetical protein
MKELNWAAVIPARYLIAKDITSTQKLLLGLVSSLSNLKGYCFASNEYLAELLNVSKIRISQSVSDLEKKGYMGRIIYRNDKKEIEQRILTLILDKNLDIPISKNDNTLPLKIDIPISKNFKENIKINNNINNKYIRPLQTEVISYFLEKGSTEDRARKAFEYYEAGNWTDSKGNKVKNWKQKMLANWINNNNFTKTTSNDKLEAYKSKFDNIVNSDWAREIDSQIQQRKENS